MPLRLPQQQQQLVCLKYTFPSSAFVDFERQSGFKRREKREQRRELSAAALLLDIESDEEKREIEEKKKKNFSVPRERLLLRRAKERKVRKYFSLSLSL